MKIGITGGIASGKTTICKLLESKGKFVYYADEEAKRMIEENDYVRGELIVHFGSKVFLPNGDYNREYVREVIFSDKNKLNAINEIFNKRLINDFNSKSFNKDVAFFESAVIFENNLQDNFKYVYGVYCSKDEQVKRIKERDGLTDEQIENVLNNQMDVQTKLDKCDFVIDTTNKLTFATNTNMCEIVEKIING